MKNDVFWNIMLVAFVITKVSGERIASIIRVTRIGQLGTTLAVTSNQSKPQRNTVYNSMIMEAIRSSETSVLPRATQRNILEDSILQLAFNLKGAISIESSQ
jgi:hypothetical protein